MGALSHVALAGALVLTPPVGASPIDRWRPLIERASVQLGIPARWIEQVMVAESRGLVDIGGKPIRSRVGAIGLMQLMPGTWAAMRARLKLGDDPDNPADNILAGAAFLRLMYDRFGYPGLFAAYNAGPARYARALAGGSPLPDETRTYLAKVTNGIGAPAKERPAPLFAVRHDQDPKSREAAPASALFAVRAAIP